MCGSPWLSSTARRPTSRLTPTCIPSSWAGRVDPGTSSRTTSWNCWGRSLTPRWPASRSANDPPSDAIRPARRWTLCHAANSGRVNGENLTIVPGTQPADAIAITSGLFGVLISIQVQTVLSVRRLFCCQWRDGETLQAFVLITH